MARIARRERMRAVVERWRRSGESAAAFCRRSGIKAQTFAYWKRVLGARGGMARKRRARRPVPGFVPVRLVGAGADLAPSGVEVVLGSGERVVVGETVSRELLRDVLQALRERC